MNVSDLHIGTVDHVCRSVGHMSSSHHHVRRSSDSLDRIDTIERSFAASRSLPKAPLVYGDARLSHSLGVNQHHRRRNVHLGDNRLCREYLMRMMLGWEYGVIESW